MAAGQRCLANLSYAAPRRVASAARGAQNRRGCRRASGGAI